MVIRRHGFRPSVVANLSGRSERISVSLRATALPMVTAYWLYSSRHVEDSVLQ
jgi:hypothetical protein